ncbi:MAG: ABC transporter substrate-binding protein [Sedimenticola sp.]
MARINIMAMRHSAFYSPLLLTICGGYLKDEGLEPEYEVATPEKPAPASIRSGKVHLSQSAVATSFETLERGGSCDIVHFAQINERDGFFIAGREPEPDFTWDRLKDCEVLVDHLFQPLAMFRYALHKLGIEEQQVNIVDAGNVEAIDTAFRAGEGDYIHQQGPFPQQLEKEGIGHVVASVGEVIGPVAFSSLCASRDWVESEMAQAFMRAYRRARQFAIEAPASEIASLESRFFPGIDPEVLAGTIATYQGLGCWTADPSITRQAYNNLLDVFLYSGLISKRHDFEACVVTPPDISFN